MLALEYAPQFSETPPFRKERTPLPLRGLDSVLASVR